MKISKIELFKVPPRWLFLKITTDSGLVGWGEPVLERKLDTIIACIKEFEDYLIGKDARNIEDIWQVLYRANFYRGGPILTSAMSGIDQALWDIKGKALNVPVYELLGGAVRERIRVYAWIGGEIPGNIAKEAKERLEQGYTAVKMNATEIISWIDSYKTIDRVLMRVQEIRDAVGDKLDIALDFHGRVHKAMARILIKELEPMRIMFVEEPVLCENKEAFIELRRNTSIPIATGERIYTRWGFKDILHDGGVDIIQPDLSHAGGISECRRIAAMAEAYDVAVAPHCPLGPIALASSIQLDFCTPNVFIQEQSSGIHYNNNDNDLHYYLVDKSMFEYKNGFVYKPLAPGLGIEINEEAVRNAIGKYNTFKVPLWRTADGIVSER